MVTLAQTLGTLSLVLNSVRDGGEESDAGGRLAKTERVRSRPGRPTRPRRGRPPPDARSPT